MGRVGTTDWIGSIGDMLGDAGQFGSQDGAKPNPPLRPVQLPFTPIVFAEMALQFFEDNARELFLGIAKVLESTRNGETNSRVARKLAALHTGDNAFQLTDPEWKRLMGSRLVNAGGSATDRDFLGEVNEAVGRLHVVLLVGRVSPVPNDTGNGDHLSPVFNSEFWTAALKLAGVAQGAQIRIEKPSASKELIVAITEVPETLGDAAEATGDAVAKAGAQVLKRAGKIAGSAFGEFLGELGIVPIVIGAAAVFVGVKYI